MWPRKLWIYINRRGSSLYKLKSVRKDVVQIENVQALQKRLLKAASDASLEKANCPFTNDLIFRKSVHITFSSATCPDVGDPWIYHFRCGYGQQTLYTTGS